MILRIVYFCISYDLDSVVVASAIGQMLSVSFTQIETFLLGGNPLAMRRKTKRFLKVTSEKYRFGIPFLPLLMLDLVHFNLKLFDISDSWVLQVGYILVPRSIQIYSNSNTVSDRNKRQQHAIGQSSETATESHHNQDSSSSVKEHEYEFQDSY